MTRSRRWCLPDPELFAPPEVVNPFGILEAETPEEAAAAEPVRSSVHGRSRDETVDAEVDERGGLLSLRIPRHLLRGAHTEPLCRAVVEAVAHARHQAGQLARERARTRVDLAHSRRARTRR